jgi:hypothetical protein
MKKIELDVNKNNSFSYSLLIGCKGCKYNERKECTAIRGIGGATYKSWSREGVFKGTGRNTRWNDKIIKPLTHRTVPEIIKLINKKNKDYCWWQYYGDSSSFGKDEWDITFLVLDYMKEVKHKTKLLISTSRIIRLLSSIEENGVSHLINNYKKNLIIQASITPNSKIDIEYIFNHQKIINELYVRWSNEGHYEMGVLQG